jgi:hypothetical protein
MSPARATTAALLLLASLAIACQEPDVGARCRMAWGEGATSPTPSTAQGDYLETGNVGCEDLVCIVSPATSGKYGSCAGGDPDAGDAGSCGYCSKPCVSDDDCYRSETGLECRQMVLDPQFIAALTPAVREKYLADVSFSSYCGVPR